MTITIDDLPRDENLDRKAMSVIRGGKYLRSKLDSAGPKASYQPSDPYQPGDPYQPSDPYRGLSLYSDSFKF